MSSEDRPPSPSILFGCLSREKKRKLLPSDKKSTPESLSKSDKETQVQFGDILDCIMYKRNRWDPSDVRVQTGILKDFNLNEERKSDPRNQEFAKLIAFELDRVPEEKRTMTYSKVLDFIRKVRHEESLGNVSLPSFDESD